MFSYSLDAEWGIKFDLKKDYHQLDTHSDFQKYFGFMYKISDSESSVHFVRKTKPSGYTRAPSIVREIMKPLIAKWRWLGAFVVVFYDDGVAVAKCKTWPWKCSVICSKQGWFQGLINVYGLRPNSWPGMD